MENIFGGNNYVAVIGDIVNSKELCDRGSVQKKMNAVLSTINRKYKSAIASNFMVTLGDEFQGLLCDGGAAIPIVRQIEAEMYPVRLRFGIGVGEISTEINRRIPLGADGPAYYNARAMIEELKSKRRKTKTVCGNIAVWCGNSAAASEYCRALNSVLSLTGAIEDRWTDRQRQVVGLCRSRGDNQNVLAKALRVNQPTVQKTLAKADYYSYKSALQTVSSALGQATGENDAR